MIRLIGRAARRVSKSRSAGRQSDGPFMLIIARTLAVLSVLFTLVAIEIIGLQYLPIGFEATGVFGSYSYLLATVTALSAIVIVSVRARSGNRAGFSFTVLLSGMSLLGLAALAAVTTWIVTMQ
jgi:hypothetical protein